MLLAGCKTEQARKTNSLTSVSNTVSTEHVKTSGSTTRKLTDYDTLLWSELTAEDNFVLDLRYATTQNFTEAQIYPCSRCFLRPFIAQKLKALNTELYNKKGYRIKLFDCYRPRPAQQKLWDIVPNATYVTQPEKGSMHNRGAAVDLTIVDNNSEELNMGTDFDFFGPEARHSYRNLPKEVIANREFLQNMMEKNGFKAITSEWWHYSFSGTGAELSDWEWLCPQSSSSDASESNHSSK